jgi:hypothetical protein
MISLSLHQIIRSGTPLITLALEWMILGRSGRSAGGWRCWLLIGVLSGIVGGIVLSVLGEAMTTAHARNPQAQTTLAAISVTALGAVVSSFKGVSTSALLIEKQYSPLQLLMLTAPVAALICALIGGVLTEEPSVIGRVFKEDSWQLLLNGFLAFLLNWAGFECNRETSALTITVAGSVKQALTVALGIVLFETRMAWMGWIGLAMTLICGLAYG